LNEAITCLLVSERTTGDLADDVGRVCGVDAPQPLATKASVEANRRAQRSIA
jgi:hypothetical protein